MTHKISDGDHIAALHEKHDSLVAKLDTVLAYLDKLHDMIAALAPTKTEPDPEPKSDSTG
jgi:hypothetical protein